LLLDYALLDPLRARVRQGLPVFGTCAGAIMLARDIGRDQPLLGVMDMVVERNAFGRQLQSFEADLPLEGLDGPPMRAAFIRAPVISAVGAGLQVLARLPDGRIVAARQGPHLATTFHPELTDDERLHRLFVTQLVAART